MAQIPSDRPNAADDPALAWMAGGVGSDSVDLGTNGVPGSESKSVHAERLAQADLKILSRALRELRQAFQVFAPYRSQRKVTMFGSARTPRDAPLYKQAMEFGRAMAAQRWLVVTGAGTGIMEAGHRGAGREQSMGLNIMLPFEQIANEIIRGDHKLVNMRYFFTRKLLFVKESDAMVCLPGGFGTLDEATEVLTLLQTGKCDLVPLVLLDEPGGCYWSDWRAYLEKHLLKTEMISREDMSLFKITDRVDEAVEEVLGFYRVYQGMDDAEHKLELQLGQRLSPNHLEQLNLQFADILSKGRIEQVVKESAEHPEVKATLVLTYNRRDYGRLRILIDAINAGHAVA